MSVLDLLVQPVLPHGLLAAGIALCTYLSLTLKQDLHRIHTEQRCTEQELKDLYRELKCELGLLHSALQEVEAKASALPQMSEPRPSMNVSRRSQVLRMHKRGERPEQIAAALNLPQNEVDLLLKLASDQTGAAHATSSTGC